MSIQIGNASLKEVYIGSTAIKEIYVGSSLVWSKASGAPPIPDGYVRITIHFDFADDATRQRLKNEVYGSIYYETYTDDDDMYDDIGTSWFTDYLYFTDIDDSDNLYLDVVQGDYAQLNVNGGCENNYGDNFDNFWVDYSSLTEDTTVTIPVANMVDGSPTLTISLNTDDVSEDVVTSYCIPFYVNGNYIDYIWFYSGAGDYYFDDNLQFTYSNLSNGDVVTFGSAEHAAGDDPTIQMLYNGEDISNASITINGNTSVTFDVIPADTYVDNEIYIPYSEINSVAGSIFSSSRYSDKILTVTLTTNDAEYPYEVTYTQDDYDSGSNLIIVSNLAVSPSDVERPDEGGTWSFTYFDLWMADNSGESGGITFTQNGNNYIGSLE